jgi:hypothetical protein
MRRKFRMVPFRAAIAVMILAAFSVAGPGIPRAVASGPPSGSLSPANLQGAYGFPSATQGYGQTVAVVSSFDDSAAASDLATYRSQYGLPACTTSNGCFTKLDLSNGTEGLSQATAQALDAVSAVCPNCHILLVEAASTGIADVGVAVDNAVSLGAKFIATTAEIPEAELGSTETSYDSHFNHPGVAITAPAGDAGYRVVYPAASPYVIAVGGTVLAADSSVARGWDESAWTSTGSGCSEYEPKPAWQTDTGCSGRTLNDIAAVATNVAYYDTPTSGGWNAGSGTVISAAVVAAAFALAGAPANDTYPAAYLYANPQGLYDITSGSNGTCVPAYLCTTGTGYDGPTGLGTPDGVSAFLASYYEPITPTRFLDTRIGTGGTTGPVTHDGTIKLTITGQHGVPAVNVTAVAINITALGGADPGYMTAYPDGASLPGTSTIDYGPNQLIASFAIVPVGTDGKIDLYNGSAGTAQLLGDVTGYFTSDPSAPGLQSYMPVNPVRILDTRNGTGSPKAKLAGGTTLALQVAGANGIPAGITALVINLTAVDETDSGWLATWADGSTQPSPWSGVQFGTSAIADLAIVPVGPDGKIDIRSNQSSANSTDLVGDVVGYFTSGTAGEAYRAAAFKREFNTGSGSPPSVASGGTETFSTSGWVTAPSPTMIVSLIAIPGTHDGDLIVYPAGTSAPNTSSINFLVGANIENLDLMSTGGGDFDVINASGSATNLAVDFQGYFSVG